MSWQAQPPEASPPPSPSNTVAWTALLLSLFACGLSGYTLFRNLDDGRLAAKLRENTRKLADEVRQLGEQTSRRIGQAWGGDEDKDTPEASIEEPDERRPSGNVQWEKIKQRVDDIRAMIADKDDRAGYYLDVLKKDLGLLRDYSAEKGAMALETIMEKVQSVRERIDSDSPGASQKLKEISDDLASRGRAILGGQPEPQPVPAPAEAPSAPHDNPTVRAADKSDPPSDLALPPPPTPIQ